ncbi:MAG: hypothetical protein PHU44_14705 [Syntrophales bacterium]|nr:hypothetical protein [Syntrophales bacterium]
MAKRPTIGENPLDAVVAENPLDAVVPPSGSKTEMRQGPPAEPDPETKKRLAVLEAEVKALQGEISLLRAKIMEMQMRLPPPEPRWVVRLREKLAGK